MAKAGSKVTSPPQAEEGAGAAPRARDLGLVQRADVIDEGVALEVFAGARGWWLLGPPGPPQRPAERPRREEGQDPPAVQKVLRKELSGGRLVDVEASEGGVRAHIELKGGKRRVLLVEDDRLDPRVVLCADKGGGLKILAVVWGQKRAADGRDLKKGRTYEAPRAPMARTTPPAAVAADASAARKASPLRAEIRAEKKRLGRLIKNLERDLGKHGDPDRWAQMGEGLKAVMHQLERGASSVTVPGPGGSSQPGASLVVELDAARSGPENLDRLFARARRARTARERIRPRLEEVAGALSTLEAAVARLDPANPEQSAPADLAAVRELLDARQSGAKHKPRRPPAGKKAGPRKPYRAFVCTGDVEVRVGRSARDNDALTFQVAKGRDTWLHSRGVVGSHVIVPVPLDKLGSELLVDAAHLAAWFSGSRGEARVDVQYTSRKHVRKPGKGAAAGLVLVSQERVLHLVVDEERLQRLLDQETV